MEEFILKDEFIKLGQLLKACGIAESGVDAKEMILDGRVQVNGEVVLQRGKKCYEGDRIEVEGQTIKVCSGSGI